MQTFLPYVDMMKSLQSLDYRRLGKQRAETKQLLQQILLRDPSQASAVRTENMVNSALENMLEMDKVNLPRLNHPACEQWWDHAGALAVYHDLSILAWKARGYNNTMGFLSTGGKHKLPEWWGDERFHSSHRSNLLRKDPVWYGAHGWTDDPAVEYFWPSREENYTKA